MKRKGFDFEDAQVTFDDSAVDLLQKLNQTKVQVGQDAKDAQIFTCEGRDYDLDNEQPFEAVRSAHATQHDKTAFVTDPI